MVVCLLLGGAVAGAALSKTVESENYKKKVKAMTISKKLKHEYEYIAIGEVNYSYTRPLAGSTRTLNEPVFSSISKIKQDLEGNGENRILAVIRNKRNGKVQFVLFTRPTKNGRNLNQNTLLKICSIDSNLKTNQGGIVDEKSIRVSQQNANTFKFEDPNTTDFQTHRKVLKIQVKNTMKKPPMNGFSGNPLCELLTHMAKDGRVPKDFHQFSSQRINNEDNDSSSIEDDDTANDHESCSSFTSTESSAASSNDSSNAATDIDSNTVSMKEKVNEVVDVKYEEDFTSMSIVATATATVTECYEEETNIPVAMATPV